MSSAQIDVPERSYSTFGPYFMPTVLSEWLKKQGLTDWSLAGSGSWGNGRHEDGTSNVEHSYCVKGMREDDCLAFKIQFPECKVHYFE